MDLFTDYITPQELTGYARAALADRPENRFILANWLPDRTINDLDYRFNKNTSGLTETASYRAWDAEPGFGSREGLKRVTGELPPIGRQMLLNEYDQLRLRGGNNIDADIRGLLERDAVRLVRQVDARFELARGDLLVNASVTIEEDGIVATAQFERNPDMSVASAVVWADHANATPIDDFEDWTQAYVDLNGELPGACILGRQEWRDLARSVQIARELYPNNPTQRLNTGDINAWLSNHDLPPITRYDAKVKHKGVETRIIEAGKVLLLPAADPDPDTNQTGATFWGTTLESLEPDYGIEDGAKPGIVVAPMKSKTTPIQVVTVAAAIGIPVLANGDLVMVADVTP